MIALDNLLGIVCTEALEHSGVPEVPEHKHGAQQNYSVPKRDARSVLDGEAVSHETNLPTLYYDLELIVDQDGAVRWEE